MLLLCRSYRKCNVCHQVSGAVLMVLFFNKNRFKRPDMDMFCSPLSADLVEMLQGGLVQTETVTASWKRLQQRSSDYDNKLQNLQHIR